MRRTALAMALLLLTGRMTAEDGRPGAVEPNDVSKTWDTGEYKYDAAGNITAIGTQSFTYDPMGRLGSASIVRTMDTTAQSTLYTYDVYGT